MVSVVDNDLALILGQLRQRVQFHALVQRFSRDGAEVVTKGFGPRIRPAYRAGAPASRGGCGLDEGTRLQIANLIGLAVAPVLRLRVQLLVDRLAAEDREGFLSDRAARRLFDRLIELGAARELSGRPNFRLYGL